MPGRKKPQVVLPMPGEMRVVSPDVEVDHVHLVERIAGLALALEHEPLAVGRPVAFARPLAFDGEPPHAGEEGRVPGWGALLGRGGGGGDDTVRATAASLITSSFYARPISSAVTRRRRCPLPLVRPMTPRKSLLESRDGAAAAAWRQRVEIDNIEIDLILDLDARNLSRG